ncbi:hypothetical protein, partial [Plasmodium yoelii yoelii]
MVEARPAAFRRRQAEPQAGRMLEPTRQNEVAPEVRVEPAGIIGPHPLEQRSASGRRQAVAGQERRQPPAVADELPAGLGLPGGIGQGPLPEPARRSGHRPRAGDIAQGFEQGGAGGDEAETGAGTTEELAEGSQHDQPLVPGFSGQASLRRGVHEGFVHHQPAASLPQRGVPSFQTPAVTVFPGRVVGIDHHHDVEPFDLSFHGRTQHGHAALCPKPGQELDRGLRAGHRQQGRRAVTGHGGFDQSVLVFPQTGPAVRRGFRKWPGTGADARGTGQPVPRA